MNQHFIAQILGRIYLHITRVYHQLVTLTYSFLYPYRFLPGKYKDSFLSEVHKLNDHGVHTIPLKRVIYVFWTGNNEMTPNRLAGIKSLERYSEVQVKLITPANLKDYILPEAPLHKAYPYLSLVHKADYLRCYFMNFYGGGYADIKVYKKTWVNAFNKLDHSDAYVIGYREVGFWGVANVGISNSNLKHDLNRYWRLLIGNGAYICKAQTDFTKSWYKEMSTRLDYYFDRLKEHPALDPYGKNLDYPIPWAGILGEIFHPLCLKYHDKLLVNNNLRPSFKNYR